MDLRQAATKPKLEKITLNSEYVIDEYGEPLEFWMWDRQKMPTYIQLSAIEKTDMAGMLDAVKGLVLDGKGNRMLDDDQELPPQVMVDMINAVVDQLGNAVGQTSVA